jgi:hypothetical protein
VWRKKKAAPKKLRKKTPVVPLGTLCRDGCLKMSNNAAERIRAIALGRKIFLLVPTPGTACGDHLHPHRECRRRRSSSSREARPKTIMAIGSLFHFACQIPPVLCNTGFHAPESPADGRRAQANLRLGRGTRRSFTAAWHAS